mmetsp:Transcript_28761/g.93973  ORF Transcript_28761/g.93973 Transcript_28761/m.93973 type:complete len:257 (+) Transcript_28761:40-810(+)
MWAGRARGGVGRRLCVRSVRRCGGAGADDTTAERTTRLGRVESDSEERTGSPGTLAATVASTESGGGCRWLTSSGSSGRRAPRARSTNPGTGHRFELGRRRQRAERGGGRGRGGAGGGERRGGGSAAAVAAAVAAAGGRRVETCAPQKTQGGDTRRARARGARRQAEAKRSEGFDGVVARHADSRSCGAAAGEESAHRTARVRARHIRKLSAQVRGAHGAGTSCRAPGHGHLASLRRRCCVRRLHLVLDWRGVAEV